MPELVILIGLPGAGKTTFYRERFAATHVHVSKDLWPNAAGREARQRRAIDEALAAGSSVVVDNTNPSAADRAALMELARARNARVIGYFFDVSTRAAVASCESTTPLLRAVVPDVNLMNAAFRR